MKKPQLYWIITATLLPLLSGAGRGQDALEQGITLHRVSSASGAVDMPEQTSTMYLDGETIRQVQPDNTELIVYHRLGKMVRIDHNAKTYSEVTFEELQARLDEVSDEISHEDLETLEELRQMAGKSDDDSVALERLGPGEPIAGYRTEIYMVSVAPVTMKIWAAPDLKIPAVYYDTMKIVAKPNPIFNMQKMFETLKQVDGLSLRSEVSMSIMGQELKSVDKVVKIERGPVPKPSIPSGYKQVDGL